MESNEAQRFPRVSVGLIVLPRALSRFTAFPES